MEFVRTEKTFALLFEIRYRADLNHCGPIMKSALSNQNRRNRRSLVRDDGSRAPAPLATTPMPFRAGRPDFFWTSKRLAAIFCAPPTNSTRQKARATFRSRGVRLISLKNVGGHQEREKRAGTESSGHRCPWRSSQTPRVRRWANVWS